jgi:cell division protein FtsB
MRSPSHISGKASLMSGFLDKLKDVGKDALGTFVVLEEDGAAQAPAAGTAAPAQPSAAASATPQAAPAGAVSVPGVAVAPDPEFVQQLQAAVDASKAPAYRQFHAVFDALSAVPDEAQRTQLALAAAQASHGINAAQVAAALDDRMKLLAEEKAAFEHAVGLEVEHSVGGTMAEVEKARAEIARKQEEIRALEARAAQLEASVREARTALDANSAAFQASYVAVEAGLAAERARIAPFVTPSTK